MFAYLRSHHRKGSQPTSPLSPLITPSSNGSNGRTVWATSPYFTKSDVDLSPASLHSKGGSDRMVTKRHNKSKDPTFECQGEHDMIQQAQSVAIMRSIPSVESIRPSSSGQSRPGQAQSEVQMRPTTAHARCHSQSKMFIKTSNEASIPGATVKGATDLRSPPSASSSQPTKSGKTKLSLLKPITYLSRRKSGQPDEQSSEESLNNHKALSVPAMKFPDNYDPSIRGKVVHDFSAPRPRRDYSSSSINAENSDMTIGSFTSLRGDPEKTDANTRLRNVDRLHTALFTEHFDDSGGVQAEETCAAVHAENLADQNFISRNLPLERSIPAKPTFEVGMLRGTFPARIDSLKPRSSAAQKIAATFDSSAESSPPNGELNSSSGGEDRERGSFGKLDTCTDQSLGVPSRWTSKASRFSFQAGGSDSAAQERLLEERHKQKAAAQGLTEAVKDLVLEDDEDTDNMYDDIYDGAGLEEQIPGVNAEMIDNDYGNINGIPISNGVAYMSLDEQPKLGALCYLPMIATSPSDGEEHQNMVESSLVSPDDTIEINSVAVEEGISIKFEQASAVEVQRTKSTSTVQNLDKFQGNEENVSLIFDHQVSSLEDNDDLYFDDGAIEETDGKYCNSFDETILDDVIGPFSQRKSFKSDLSESQKADEEASSETSPRAMLAPPPRLTSLRVNTNVQEPPNMTLNAYHGALADAANRAVAEGKFDRHDSLDIDNSFKVDGKWTSRKSSPDIAKEGVALIKDDMESGENNISSSVAFDLSINKEDHFNDFKSTGYDYDSNAEEDDIVAEANAEALANDDEGFYGQEFGFYAQAFGNGSGEGQAANGGFFGPRKIDGLGRSGSGRNAVQEPNLTPITERSEYSTRDSYISLLSAPSGVAGMSGSGHLSAPSIAALATSPSSATHSSPNLSLSHIVSPYGFEEDDMTISQLLRLRRGVFGGSSGSLKSGDNSSLSGPGSATDEAGSHPSPLFAVAGASPMSMNSSHSSISPLVGPVLTNVQAMGITGPINQTTLQMPNQLAAEAIDTCHYTENMSDYDNAEDEDYEIDNGDDDFDDESLSAPGSPTLTSTDDQSVTTFATGIPATTVLSSQITNIESIADLPLSTFLSPKQIDNQPQPRSDPEMLIPTPKASLPSTIVTPASPVPAANNSHSTSSSLAQTVPTKTTTMSSSWASTASPVQPARPPPPSPPPQELAVPIELNTIYTSDDANAVLSNKSAPISLTLSQSTSQAPSVQKSYKKTHRRNGSSTDSVSVAYIRERDSAGEDRWVLERRRTAEGGVVELVGREIVAGGRI